MTNSYNGWPASKDPHAIHVVPFHPFDPGVKDGDVKVVFTRLVQLLEKYVEPHKSPGCWGYSYRQNRNANNLSCHASGTAIDYNAPKHPNGKAGTFKPAQVVKIHEIVKRLGHIVAWGGDFHTTKDEMHFEIHGSPEQVKHIADLIRGRKI